MKKKIDMEESLVGCECQHKHDDIVSSVKEKMLGDEMILDLAELFKVLGDPTRIRIIYILFNQEMCVCDIADSLNMTQSAISHQLRVLKQARLVKFRKEGKTVYYSLDDEHITKIFDCGLHHIEEMYNR